MKTPTLALLILATMCTACARKEEPSEAPTPSPVDAASNPTAPIDATADANAAGNAPAASAAEVPAPRTAHAALTSAAGSAVQGGLTLVNQGAGVSFRGEITGLEPGKEHGFHVHETGDCSLPSFEGAGEHFNPTEDPHGGPESKARHLGDLPNAKADDNGRALINFDVEGLTLVDKDGAPTEILGKAIIVHAKPDDYKTQPSGGSGERIACGVIR